MAETLRPGAGNVSECGDACQNMRPAIATGLEPPVTQETGWTGATSGELPA